MISRGHFAHLPPLQTILLDIDETIVPTDAGAIELTVISAAVRMTAAVMRSALLWRISRNYPLRLRLISLNR